MTAESMRLLGEHETVLPSDWERWDWGNGFGEWSRTVVWHRSTTVADRRAKYAAGGVAARVEYGRKE